MRYEIESVDDIWVMFLPSLGLLLGFSFIGIMTECRGGLSVQ